MDTPLQDFVFEKLYGQYGKPSWRKRLDPLDELIFTVLTQHTSDLNAEKAFLNLKSSIPNWEEVRLADETKVARLIKSGGLSNIKAKRIKDILNHIYKEQGVLSLEYLRRYDPYLARQKFMELPGVGMKSASVVLSFTFDMPLLAVDTHVHRVTKRLGLIPDGISADKAHIELEKIVKPKDRFLFHALLITHGRKICVAIKPRCETCPLKSRCKSSLVKPS